MIIRNVMVAVLIVAGVGRWLTAFMSAVHATPESPYQVEPFLFASILMALARIVWLMETPK